MTAPLIVGVPSAAHREALLRETAGGGRVPLLSRAEAYVCDDVWVDTKWCPYPILPHPGEKRNIEHALILSHPDPEAGAMGLARLAWVAEPGSRWVVHDHGVWWHVWLDHPDPEKCRTWRVLPSEAGEGGEPAAIGFVARVHLGLLERVERVEVPRGG